MAAIARPLPSRHAIVSPVVDTICVGGLSIVATLGLLAFVPAPLDKHFPTLAVLLLSALVTWPHFLSSYRLLYSSRESILTYRKASIFFPAVIAAYGVFAISRASADKAYMNLMWLIAGVYAARHYTGQTWGMIASFAHMEGVPPSARERSVMQWGLHSVMTWHIVWATAQGVGGIGGVAPSLAPIARWLDARIDPLAAIGFVLGLTALGMMARRTRSLPPARVVVPWLALFGWYALLRRDPTSLVVVQAAHSLQYLVFPLRIEETRRDPSARPLTARRAALWLGALLVLGVGVFAGIPALFRLCYVGAGGTDAVANAFLLVFLSAVNIHHFFIDGCLYKLRNPAVRRDLFAHLEAHPDPGPAGAPSAVAPAA
jgi:hypothetical protein